MIVQHHISTDYHEVLPTDSIETALDIMADLYIKDVVIADNKNFIGIVTEDQLLDQDDTERELASISHYFKHTFIYEYQHIYDALHIIASTNLFIIPVLNAEQEYVGVIDRAAILKAMNQILGNEEGGIIVLEIDARDNALSLIARLIEAEGASILSTAVNQGHDPNTLNMTIKVNQINIDHITASLQHNNYTIKAAFGNNVAQSDLQDRYNLLMNYLDL